MTGVTVRGLSAPTPGRERETMTFWKHARSGQRKAGQFVQSPTKKRGNLTSKQSKKQHRLGKRHFILEPQRPLGSLHQPTRTPLLSRSESGGESGIVPRWNGGASAALAPGGTILRLCIKKV